MKPKRTSLAFAAVLLWATGFGQITTTPEASLRSLPMPPLNAGEAIARCPQNVDTLVRAIVQELSDHAHHDSIDESARNWHIRLQTKLLGKPQRELDQSVFAAGEQLDKEIRDCPKVANENGERVYDPPCVEAAEQRAHRRRVAAVDQYLSAVHQVWPAYVDSTLRVIAETRNGKWRVVLRVAGDVATITQTAAEFAR